MYAIRSYYVMAYPMRELFLRVARTRGGVGLLVPYGAGISLFRPVRDHRMASGCQGGPYRGAGLPGCPGRRLGCPVV